jgi:hypothetical protein
MMTSAAKIEPGDVPTREKIRPVFGGAPYGGICPAIAEKNVIVYSDPEVGEKLGYHDGWLVEEDELGAVFEYTGAGESGDQELNLGRCQQPS